MIELYAVYVECGNMIGLLCSNGWRTNGARIFMGAILARCLTRSTAPWTAPSPGVKSVCFDLSMEGGRRVFRLSVFGINTCLDESLNHSDVCDST